MQQWLNARCAQLLDDLNNTPFTDDVDEIKLNLIRAAMREASLEMFNRAAENSRKKIDQINKQAKANIVKELESASVDDVMADTEALLAEAKPKPVKNASPGPVEKAPSNSGGLNSAFGSMPEVSTEEDKKPEEPEKPEPKLQLSSSVIRRAD